MPSWPTNDYYPYLTDRETLAVEQAERIAMDLFRDPDFWVKLKGKLSEKEVVELTFACIFLRDGPGTIQPAWVRRGHQTSPH